MSDVADPVRVSARLACPLANWFSMPKGVERVSNTKRYATDESRQLNGGR